MLLVCNEETIIFVDDFYKYTRGYYYYVALSIKIIQAMKISLSEFLQKFNQSEASFDEYSIAIYDENSKLYYIYRVISKSGDKITAVGKYGEIISTTYKEVVGRVLET